MLSPAAGCGAGRASGPGPARQRFAVAASDPPLREELSLAQRLQQRLQPERGRETMGPADGDYESQELLQDPPVDRRWRTKWEQWSWSLPRTKQEKSRVPSLHLPAAGARSPGAPKAQILGSQKMAGAPSTESVSEQGDQTSCDSLGPCQPGSSFPSDVSCPGHRCYYWKCTVVLGVALGVVSLGFLIAVAALTVLQSGCSPAVQGPACPDGWVGYQGKCFYFSKGEGNWAYSQSNCSALGASLAAIDTLQEMAFLLRYKEKPDHWIGLQKDSGQLWKWANGTEFNHLFEIRGGGDCAYLNEIGVGSLRCTGEAHWICCKPDAFTAAKETPAGGGS